MTDDKRQASRSAPLPASRLQTRKLDALDCGQLTLPATITGPGMRTEDHYERGTKVKLRGQQGILTYTHATVSQAGQVSLHLVGEGGFRAVRPEKVMLVQKGGPRR